LRTSARRRQLFSRSCCPSLLRPLTEPTPGRSHRRGDQRAAGTDRQVRYRSDVGRRAHSIQATGSGNALHPALHPAFRVRRGTPCDFKFCSPQKQAQARRFIVPTSVRD
jgi:hypothetical protein